MQDRYAEVPKSERFPLAEIFEQFPTARRYFTSSVAYAIALAIYKGYKVIEIYGVEMETNSEYGHQRTGVAYWVGFAEGRGIYVDFHSHKFFNEPLYGYEGEVAIPLEQYERRIADVLPHIAGSRDALDKTMVMTENLLNEFVKSYKTDMTPIDDYILACGQNAHNNGMFEGSKEMNEHYLHKCLEMKKESGGQYLIVRQEFESEAQGATKAMQKALGMLQVAASSLKEKRDELNTVENKGARAILKQEFLERFKNYIDTSHDVGKFNGIRQENVLIMQTFDALLRASGIQPDKVKIVETEPAEVPA